MSVASIGPSIHNIYTTNATKKIEIDFKKLKINPEEKGIINIENSMTLTKALDEAEGTLVDFMAATTVVFKNGFVIDGGRYRQTLDQRPAMTFKSAVETVVKALNDYAAESGVGKEEFFRFDCSGKNLESQLILAIANIETTGIIPKPPQHGGMESWANETHNRYWLGAILSMLHEQKYINTFGYKADIGFWVKL